MRINDNRGPQDVNVGSASSTSQAKAKGAEEPKAREADHSSVKVKLSAKARELAEQAHVDEAKVARLREALEKGELKIDARAIAQKLVGDDA